MSIHEKAIELLFRSLYQPGPGRPATHEFMFGEPGGWHKGFRTGVYYDASALLLAALAVRRDGPAYYKKMPIEHTEKLLKDFIAYYYWHLFDECFARPFEESYWERLSNKTKSLFATLLAKSAVFSPRDELTVFPLIPVRVESNFDSKRFFLVKPEALDETRLPGSAANLISPTRFPPYKQWRGVVEDHVGSWLGIRSPAVEAAHRIKAAILGALALTPTHNNRRMFSMRKMFGGSCTIEASISISFGDPATPALMHDITITDRDHDWLIALEELLESEKKEARRQVRALEYYYRAWFLGPAERFPVLCMTIDSVFGDISHATQAVIDGVRSTLGSHIEDSRLRLLADLRAAVIHGGAPEIYDSRKYAQYIERYGEDPVHDMDLIVAESLRKRVFRDRVTQHPGPNAALIAQLIAEGKLLRRVPNILGES